MHDNPARVTNGRQVLDADATHTEIQGIKKGDEGAYQVLTRATRSGRWLSETTYTAGHTQHDHTLEVLIVPASNERVQEN